MSVLDRTLSLIKERKSNVKRGIKNSIPSPFRRFSSQYIGVERGTYYLVTGGTKSAKTQISCYMFLFSPILYSYKYPSVKVKIFYYALEESPERLLSRFISYILYQDYNLEVDYKTLMSSKNVALSDEIEDIIHSEEMQKKLAFFNECVTFISDDCNPTGVYNNMIKYYNEIGTTHYKTIKAKDELGQEVNKQIFSHYTPNNPYQYTLCIFDHMSLIPIERGFSLKQSIDKLSEYFVILRNRYNLSPVLIAQQAFNETADNFKAGLTKPTLTGLSDSKYPSRDP